MYVFKDFSDEGDNFVVPDSFTQIWYNKNCAMGWKEKIWRPDCPEGDNQIFQFFNVFSMK